MPVHRLVVLACRRSLSRETTMSFAKCTGVGNAGEQRKDPDEQHRGGKASLG
jgi:hypothetical protein